MDAIEGQQERVLRTFTTLYTLREDWGGALILAVGLNPQGAALALASNIAGAVCLSLEDDPTRIREAVRSGACDFIVNTLDEALRTIKNEVRKRLPLSVGLQADPAVVLRELIERGVSPEILTVLSPRPAASDASVSFKSSGASILDFDDNNASQFAIQVQAQLEAFLQRRSWHIQSFTFETSLELRAFDADLLSLLPEHDELRRRWLRAAPKLFQRERPFRRLLWLTDDERQIYRR